METLIEIINVIGYISTAIVIISVIYSLVLFIKGILPVIYRLGKGLAQRKIAVFAKGDNLVSLKKLLSDSKLIKDKNIIDICIPGDLKSSVDASIFLVNYNDWKDNIEEILNSKSDSCPMIVYAPRNQAPIPDLIMEKIDGHRHTSISNFRGRLLNDIVTTMITTSCGKK